MTTYNTYQEAKIANPESNIYIHAGEFWCEKSIRPSSWTYEFRGFKLCNPADYCMTVEKFLADGYKFVGGDVLLTSDKSSVKVVGRNYDGDDMSVATCNTPMSDIDCDVLILRAAALEEKKPRTKVEYVRCEYGDKVSNIVMDFENDAPLYKMVNDEYWAIDELDDLFSIILDGGEHIYRRTETPMTEREAFVEALNDLFHSHTMSTSDLFNAIVDSGKFKLVN